MGRRSGPFISHPPSLPCADDAHPPPAHQTQLATLMMGDQRWVPQVDDATLVWAQTGRRHSQRVIREKL